MLLRQGDNNDDDDDDDDRLTEGNSMSDVAEECCGQSFTLVN